MSKHTPGPWEFERLIDNNGKTFSTLYEAHISVGPCMIWAPPGHEEQEANARLIAAAPDLLAALENLLDRYIRVVEDNLNWNPSTEQEVIDAEKAIARAKGEEEKAGPC